MASSYLTRTPSSDSNRTKWTFSAWIKKSTPSASSAESMILSAGVYNTNQMLQLFNQDEFILRHYNSNGTLDWGLTTAKTRDPSAWYHLVVTFDTAQATSTDRVKIYLNGSLATVTGSYPSQNQDSVINSTLAQNIGFRSGSSYYFNGLMTHIHLCDGYAYAASDFGETDTTSGIWKPKTAPSVSYGTNGFFLKFENSGSMGTDSSGNGNNFTVSGTLTQSPDTPSNNFCTINPLDTYYFENSTFANGNLTVSGNNSSFTFCTSTLGVSAGKWYMEAKLSAAASGGSRIGVVGRTSTAINEGLGDRQDEIAHQTNGDLKVNGTTTSSWGSTWTVGDIIGIALDLDNNKIYFSKNGTYQASGNPSTAANGVTITAADSTTDGVYRFGFGDNNSTGTSTFQYNFGSGFFGTTAVASANADGNGIGAFEYAVPTGYYAVCTKNIKEFG